MSRVCRKVGSVGAVWRGRGLSIYGTSHNLLLEGVTPVAATFNTATNMNLNRPSPTPRTKYGHDDVRDFQDVSMLTMLTRYTTALANGNGDPSMPFFQPATDIEGLTFHPVVSDKSRPTEALEVQGNEEFTTLEAFSAILVRDHEIVASCYQSAKGDIDVTLLTNSNELEDAVDVFDVDGMGVSDKILPLNVTAIPNATEPTKMELSANWRNPVMYQGLTITRPSNPCSDIWKTVKDAGSDGFSYATM